MSLFPPLILANPAARVFRASISAGLTFLRTESLIVVICGANISPDRPIPVRETLLDYARKYFLGFRFVRAEDVFSALKEKAESDDLLTIEDQIGNYSDCIIIVCESESAFAELGAFTLSDKLVEQVLIVNDERYKTTASFIGLGPIARANRKSKFKPAVYGNFKAILKSAVEIEERLKTIQRTNRSNVNLSTGSKFKDALPKLRLLFLADLVHYFAPIGQNELVAIIKTFYEGGSFDIELELALLESLRFIERTKSELLRYALNETSFFYDYLGVNTIALRASVIRYYFQNDRERMQILVRK